MIKGRHSVNVLTLLLLIILGGCGASTVTVQGEYPTPNVPPKPLTLGVYYPDEFRNFVYTEFTDRGSEEYFVQAGNSHINMFNTLLPAMFQQVVILDNQAAASAAGVDAVFIPSIDEFQLGIPAKTRLDSYEVWVRYNMRLTRPDGGYIADWVMTAYGKSSQGSFSSTERGINDAAVASMRDLASNFALTFDQIPEVSDWLRARNNTVTASRVN